MSNECGGYYCSEDIGHIDCDKAIIDRYRWELEHVRALLKAVFDAGLDDAAHCDCDQVAPHEKCPRCAAWHAVRKELRGE